MSTQSSLRIILWSGELSKPTCSKTEKKKKKQSCCNCTINISRKGSENPFLFFRKYVEFRVLNKIRCTKNINDKQWLDEGFLPANLPAIEETQAGVDDLSSEGEFDGKKRWKCYLMSPKKYHSNTISDLIGKGPTWETPAVNLLQ